MHFLPNFFIVFALIARFPCLLLASQQSEEVFNPYYVLGEGHLKGTGGFPKDLDMASHFFRTAGEQGNSMANLKLARIMSSNVNPDYAAVIERYKLAADAGNVEAAFELGNLYITLPCCIIKGLRYIDQAAKGGYPVALHVSSEILKSLKQKSARNPSALLLLGLLYESGVIVGARDLNEAHRYLLLAGPKAYGMLGHLFSVHDKSRSLSYFKVAILSNNDTDAMNSLGLMLLGDPMTEKKGVSLITLAFTQDPLNNGRVKNNMAICLYLGLGGLAQDPTMAINIFQDAVTLGSEAATKNLQTCMSIALFTNISGQEDFVWSLYPNFNDMAASAHCGFRADEDDLFEIVSGALRK